MLKTLGALCLKDLGFLLSILKYSFNYIKICVKLMSRVSYLLLKGQLVILTSQSTALEVGLKNANKDSMICQRSEEEKTPSRIFCMKEEGYTLLKLNFSFQIFSSSIVMIWAYLLLGSVGVSETCIS